MEHPVRIELTNLLGLLANHYTMRGAIEYLL